jgi:NAD(P)-dependent dehydrogenase (short-subunit alcohol dehydrogenase family)
MKAEIPEMLDRGGGRIVNTSSISGLTGTVVRRTWRASTA